MKIGRNDPCPCGSGKKFKKCCIDDELIIEALEEPNELAYAEADELDELSNSVVDDIDSGELDKAETTSRLLLERYPDQVDGLERLASVYEARGNYTKAADYYKQAAEFMESHPGFDREFINWARMKAKEMEGRAPGL